MTLYASFLSMKILKRSMSSDLLIKENKVRIIPYKISNLIDRTLNKTLLFV